MATSDRDAARAAKKASKPDASAASQEATIAKLLQSGLDHYGDGEVGSAFRCWKRVLELDPGNADALNYIDSADRRNGRAEGPTAASEAAGAESPKNVEELLARARAHLGAGEISTAFECWRAVVALDPSNREACAAMQVAERRTEPREPEDSASSAAPPGATANAAPVEDDDTLSFSTSARTGAAEAPLDAGTSTAIARTLVRDAMQLIDEGNAEASLELLTSAAETEPGSLEIQGLIELVRAHLLVTYREKVGELNGVPQLIVTPQQMTQFNLPAQAGFMVSHVDGNTSVADLIAVSGMDAFDARRTLIGLLDAGIVRISA